MTAWAWGQMLPKFTSFWARTMHRTPPGLRLKRELMGIDGLFMGISWEILMEEILHQLIGGLSVYPMIDRVSTIRGGAGFLPPTVSWDFRVI